MTLITPEYLRLNTTLHATTNYGGGGWKWVGITLHFFQRQKAARIIDYGCGQGSFGAWWPSDLGLCINYDPVTFPARPTPQALDFVVCTDVLEHIEPDCLDAVLDDIATLAQRGALLVIATKPAKKALADGRNAHLIIEQAPFWVQKLTMLGRFKHVTQIPVGKSGELVLFCER